MAQSDREQDTLLYVVYKASGLTSTKARKLYGFENMNSCALHVDDSIVQMKRIQEAVDEMASIQDKAVLSRFGVNYADSSDCDDDCSDSDVDPAERYALEITVSPSTNLSPSLENMTTLMKLSNYSKSRFRVRIQMTMLDSVIILMTKPEC